MRISIAQFEITAGDVDKNVKKGLELIKQAKENKSDLILLPEVWTTGFPFKQLKSLSKTTEDVLNEVKKLSDGMCICGSYVVDNPENDKVFNIFHAIYNQNIIFSYKKTMLFRPTGEDKYFDAGDINQKNTFDFNGVKIGVSICYELRFPEFFRKAAFNGAILHLLPAMWPKPRCRHWQVLSETRAIENQLYVFTANATKISGKWNTCGLSSVFDPWGENIVSLDSSYEGIYTVYINPEDALKIRSSFPALHDFQERFPYLFKK